ncbi:hypothetical protein [Roseateles sp.]|uniref:hypothetical protein n=1 Tax=Roseateles sp. TaxID=1971397 RepID=UPI0025EDBBC5|nr:hypothetical protein [Roseateles sp.]MBV8036519.1 hypothetical protein [Roseateles sp.]
MNSAKSGRAVALADELQGGGWRQPRKAIRVVAVLCALLAAATVFGLFDRFGIVRGEAKPQRQLIAAVDLRIGNPAGAVERGEAKAREDIDAGLLQLQVFGPAGAPARAEAARAKHLKQRYGVTWVRREAAATPLTQAFADGYNRVMQAEIERRHGREFLDELMRGEHGGPTRQEQTS